MLELAGRQPGDLTSATKSNGIIHTMPFWDEVVRERAAEHPDVRWDQELIDALATKRPRAATVRLIVASRCSATSS